MTQTELIKLFFTLNPNRDIPHPEAVDWLTTEWNKRNDGSVFRDPDRGIRKLAQDGFLIKVAKGVYRHEPENVQNRKLQDFPSSLKKQILARDNYKCVVCGKGTAEGVELHVDHIKPKDFGGNATLENGQTLCAQHNFLKKNFNQTETGKKMFIRLYELAKHEGNTELVNFCLDIFAAFEKNGINGHIEWEK